MSIGHNKADVETILDIPSLARALAPHLRVLLAAQVEPGFYSSTSLPPRVNARTFARWCRTRVEGAAPDGRGWRCGVEAWRRARAAGKRRAPVVHALGSDEEEARAMVEAARARR
jgi:hypothetical protein